MRSAKRVSQRLAEAADRFGDHDPVDPVLQVRVVAAHVQLAVRVADDPGRAQHDLVQRRGVAERQVRDVGRVEAVDRAAGLGRERAACGIELGPFAFDDHLLELFDRRTARRTARRRSGAVGAGHAAGCPGCRLRERAAAGEGQRQRRGAD